MSAAFLVSSVGVYCPQAFGPGSLPFSENLPYGLFHLQFYDTLHFEIRNSSQDFHYGSSYVQDKGDVKNPLRRSVVVAPLFLAKVL